MPQGNPIKNAIKIPTITRLKLAKIDIQKVESAKATDVKAFLFEKKLVDTRYVNAIRNYIERMYENAVIGPEPRREVDDTISKDRASACGPQGNQTSVAQQLTVLPVRR